MAILGAGLMGSSLALLLARRGHDIVLVDKAVAPMCGASRWNEGKVHLGYLYSADASLATARHVLPGGLAFDCLVRELVASDTEPHLTDGEDVYLVHRNSVVTAAQMRQTFAGIDGLLAAHAPGVGQSRELVPAELATLSGSPDVVGGFAVPERSIDTNWLADRIADAVAAEPRIHLSMATNVTGAAPLDDDAEDKWLVTALPEVEGAFDVVINALWEGRLAVDVTAGLVPPPGWSHRYRLCLFVTTRQPIEMASAVVAVGPFGDVKNYDGTKFYLSWYPVGLRAEGTGLTLDVPRLPDQTAFVREVRAGLSPLMPYIGEVLDHAVDIKMRGGFVFAQAQGALDRVRSSIHRRDSFGVRRNGNYFSVDTGKFSTAPWLAQQIVGALHA